MAGWDIAAGEGAAAGGCTITGGLNEGLAVPAQAVSLAIEVAQKPFCGDADHTCPTGDLDYDCRVAFGDLAVMASNWLGFIVATTRNSRHHQGVEFSLDADARL